MSLFFVAEFCLFERSGQGFRLEAAVDPDLWPRSFALFSVWDGDGTLADLASDVWGSL